ncbi:MAG TPA: hypothetical protein VL588_08540 [Bdellovibrionota bacterium]|nr:hypothetical protein [Bdellovibrionota bacterium]
MKTNHLILGLAALMASSPAMAKTVDFSDGILARVQAVQNGQERVRVFLNRTLVVERSTDAGTDTTNVSGDVDVVLEQHKLKETIKRGVRGKIVAIEQPTATGNYTAGKCDDKHGQVLVYITFDPSCNAKECAWGFSRAYGLQANSSYATDANGNYIVENGSYVVNPTCAVYGQSNDSLWYLSKVPGNSLYSHVETYSKKGLMKRHMSYMSPMGNNEGGVYYTDKKAVKYSIHLQVDLDELLKVVSQSVNHPGVGNPDHN